MQILQELQNNPTSFAFSSDAVSDKQMCYQWCYCSWNGKGNSNDDLYNNDENCNEDGDNKGNENSDISMIIIFTHKHSDTQTH